MSRSPLYEIVHDYAILGEEPNEVDEFNLYTYND